MNILLSLVLTLTMVGFIIHALIQTYGWWGFITYAFVGTVVVLERLTRTNRKRRHARMVDGSWWRDLA